MAWQRLTLSILQARSDRLMALQQGRRLEQMSWSYECCTPAAKFKPLHS